MEIIRGNNDNYVLDEENLIRKKGRVNTIIKGHSQSTNQNVVIKKFPLKNEYQTSLIEQEANINIDHPGLARTLDFFISNEQIYIIREFIQGIDLKQFINARKFHREADRKFYVKCVIKALDALLALHKRQIIHCDIKPSNIILEYENNRFSKDDPKIKLIDYGMAKLSNDLKTEDKKIKPFALIYSPPEVLLNISSLINESSDIFSMGITLYELITGKPPINDDNPLKLIALQMVYPLQKSSKIPEKLFTILEKACYKYPLKKPPYSYPLNQLNAFLKEGQTKRYKTAKEFKNQLEQVIPDI